MRNPLSRRAALKLTGGLSLGGLVSKVTTRASIPPAFAMASRSNLVATVGEDSRSPLQHVQGIIESEYFSKDMLRIDGLDPDIAALRSVSPAMKQRMMMVRRLTEQSVLDKIRRLAWP